MVAIGPLYKREDDDHLTLAFRVDKHHCNPRTACHGGVLATFIDLQLGFNATRWAGLGGPTVGLSIDYIAPAPLGAWVEGRSELLGKTGRLAFVQCLVRADGQIVARASGLFRPKFEPASPLPPGQWGDVADVAGG
nr:PaaI family thioesterase [uncultured Brevundimonas sp.]